MTVSDNGHASPLAPVGNILELRDIRAGYDAIEILHGVTLSVAQGTVFGLLGPNGAGKTTLLRVAAGLHRPTQGDLVVAGRRVNDVRPDVLARAGVCTLPEGRGIFPNLSVRENLWMSTYRGVRLGDVEERAYTRFPRLAERRTQPAGTLSGGEQQMLAIARAIATEPALLLLDELSMGLAPIIVRELYQIVRQIAAEGVSVLVVEQFAKTVLGVADLAAIMTQGQIVRVGSPEELGDELESAYLGGNVSRTPPRASHAHSIVEGEAGTS
jgi:branched-chain amino acid transport system ATP-binding protein